MSAPQNETLGVLATRLAARLGFASQGAPTITGNPLMFELLKDAQDQLIAYYSDSVLRRINESVSTVVGTTLFDIPNDMDPGKIVSIAVKVGSIWHELKQGIKYYHASVNSGTYPNRYDIRYGTTNQGQIELWPTPSAIYPLRMEYFMRETAFATINDKSTVDSRLVFLHALANGKAHYNRPDAQIYGAQLESLLKKLKAQQFGNKRFFFGVGSPDVGEYDYAPDFSTQTV